MKTGQDGIMKNPDDVMAEYLLKGGKMLAKGCAACGSPLFEYKGETKCVVCEQQRAVRKDEIPIEKAPAQQKPAAQAVSGSVAEELEKTVLYLCRRVQEEPDPQRCLQLMECIRIGMAMLHP
jgi:UPF0148 protein